MLLKRNTIATSSIFIYKHPPTTFRCFEHKKKIQIRNEISDHSDKLYSSIFKKVSSTSGCILMNSALEPTTTAAGSSKRLCAMIGALLRKMHLMRQPEEQFSVGSGAVVVEAKLANFYFVLLHNVAASCCYYCWYARFHLFIAGWFVNGWTTVFCAEVRSSAVLPFNIKLAINSGMHFQVELFSNT